MSEALEQLEALLSYVQEKRRVCPLPQQWDRLYKLLANNKVQRTTENVPAPLILSAWWNSTDQDKRLRLREHIEIAAKAGILENVDEFLRTLPLDAWHYDSNE
jgi:hypothetical protein